MSTAQNFQVDFGVAQHLIDSWLMRACRALTWVVLMLAISCVAVLLVTIVDANDQIEVWAAAPGGNVYRLMVFPSPRGATDYLAKK
jgi:hypothetical protein